MFPLIKNLSRHGGPMLSVSVMWDINEAPVGKKMHFKSVIQCFKEVKICTSDEIYHTHLPPIDCSVRIDHNIYGLIKCDTQS